MLVIWGVGMVLGSKVWGLGPKMCKDLEAARHHFHSELGCWLPGTLGLEACEQKAAAWFRTLGLWGLKVYGLKGLSSLHLRDFGACTYSLPCSSFLDTEVFLPRIITTKLFDRKRPTTKTFGRVGASGTESFRV